MATRGIGLALALLMAIGAVAALASGFALASQPDAAGLEVSAGASGEALVVTGPVPFALDQTAPTTGRLDVRAVDQGGRWSPLQSQDTVDLTAEFTHPRDGATYRVEMTKPMRQEPEGRYTTWFGVGLGHAHHGDTGIDTSSLPRVASKFSVWGYADVYREGQLLAGGVPAHMMVVQKDQGSLPGQVFLTVGTEERDVVGTPDGYLSVVWHQADHLATPNTQGIDRTHDRQGSGGLRLAAALGHLWQLGRREILGLGATLFTVVGLLFLAFNPWPTWPSSRRKEA